MKITITTDYDDTVGDFVKPVTIDVPAPPFSGLALITAYEVEGSENGRKLNEWATKHLAPHVRGDSTIVEQADESALMGCEFTFDQGEGPTMTLELPVATVETLIDIHYRYVTPAMGLDQSFTDDLRTQLSEWRQRNA